MDVLGLVGRGAFAAGLAAGLWLSAENNARAEAGGEAACQRALGRMNALCGDHRQVTAALEKLDAADEAGRAPLNARIAKLEESPFFPLCTAGPQRGGCKDLATLLELVVNGLTDGSQAESAKARVQAQAQAEASELQQPDRRTSTNKSGAVGAVDPVESVQPITLAGGALSLAGTRTGTDGVATVTVNPLALANSRDPRASRMLDLSVTTPFRLDGGSGDNLRFVGVRLRTNLAALWSTESLRQKLDAFYAAAGQFGDTLDAVLRSAPDVAGCVDSVLRLRKVTREACGQTLEQAKMEKLRADSYEALARARRQADRHYLGVDMRVDVGDPTGDATPGDDGTRIQGGLAAGIRIPQGKRWDFELRGHAGGDYFHSKKSVGAVRIDPVYSFDWGAAALLSGNATDSTDKQRMAFGMGVVGRHAKGTPTADLVPTNFVDLRLMVIVPTTAGSDLGLAFTIPINDSAVARGTIVTFSTDLGLLDGNQGSAARSSTN